MVRIVASEVDGANLPFDVDVAVSEGDEIMVGELCLRFIITPGHTPGGLCILVDNDALLTGDTLFIDDCGRADLPGGSLPQMYQTLREKIMSLPDCLVIYPGHDYGDRPFDTLGRQKQTNKALRARSLDEFSLLP